MMWEVAGYSLYLAGVIFSVSQVKIPSPLRWPFMIGATGAAILWPVLLLNGVLWRGIGGRK